MKPQELSDLILAVINPDVYGWGTLSKEQTDIKADLLAKTRELRQQGVGHQVSAKRIMLQWLEQQLEIFQKG